MIVVFSFLLYPLFFLLIYAAAEYLLPTSNSALLFSLALAAACSGLYYLVRSHSKEKSEKKKEERKRIEQLKRRAMLLAPERFSSCFPKNALCDNGYAPLSAERLLAFIRSHPESREVTVYTLNGISEEAHKLARELCIMVREMPTETLLQAIPEEILPTVAWVPEKPFKEKLMRILRSPVFEKSARRYGFFFLFYSFLTPYKLYYIFFGLFLLGFCLLIRYERKYRQHQSTKSNSRSPI